ncbi:DUF5908 family protein [Pricia sp. S334]|uniref:DUF5908 family protein n=1 Tax=Pricia mediterranea TaxID=3076079 RepID=A0ABU3L3J1_9FLAO|nr:DUF5908 family protein [Pricia sp. S334]MDT7828247.1 DUF5908 family protein [Pricia sp. S334]
MPLEIRELIIKAKVDENGGAATGGEGAKTGEEIKVNEIVEKVFDILKQKSER